MTTTFTLTKSINDPVVCLVEQNAISDSIAIKYIKSFDNNESYQGFVNSETNKYHGNGIIKYLNNPEISSYNGEWKDGLYNGHGTILFKNEEFYIGTVFNSKRNGFGTMYKSDGKFLYDGEWFDDIIDKPIYYRTIINNELIYEGFKKNNKNEGWGLEYSDIVLHSIKFYQDGNVTKEIICFPFIICSYYTENFYIKKLLTEIQNPNKPNNLITFLTTENIQILDSLARTYPCTIPTSLIIYNLDYSINQIIIYDENDNTNITIYDNQDELIVGSVYLEDYKSGYGDELLLCKFTHIKQGKKYLKKLLNIQNIQNIENNILSDEGDFIFNNNRWLLNGIGVKRLMNIKYTGNFINDIFISGTIHENNIMIYNGKFKNNKYDEQGILYYPNGTIKYKGNFINGLFNGIGSINYINTNVIEYTGEWLDNMKHGIGTLYANNGSEIYTGQFSYDQIS